MNEHIDEHIFDRLSSPLNTQSLVDLLDLSPQTQRLINGADAPCQNQNESSKAAREKRIKIIRDKRCLTNSDEGRGMPTAALFPEDKKEQRKRINRESAEASRKRVKNELESQKNRISFLEQENLQQKEEINSQKKFIEQLKEQLNLVHAGNLRTFFSHKTQTIPKQAAAALPQP